MKMNTKTGTVPGRGKNLHGGLISILLLFAFSAPLVAEEPLSLTLSPRMSIPLGPWEDASTPLFKTGWGSELAGRYSLPAIRPAYFQGLFGIDTLPVNGTSARFTLLSAGAGGGAEFSFGKYLYAGAGASGGYWYGLFPADSGTMADGFFFAGAAGELGYRSADNWRLGIGISYRHLFYRNGSIFDGVGIGLTGSIRIPSGGKVPRIDPGDIRLDPVFPVLYSRYNENALGKFAMTNEELGPIRDFTVSLFAPQYMDQPRVCAVIDKVAEGETVEMPLYAIFADRVLDITEGTVVTATISLDYRYYGIKKHSEQSAPMTMYNRNAMTWDDDRKAACFVTAMDPEVLELARNIDAFTSDPKGSGIGRSMKQGIAIAEAVATLGVIYAIDPSSPFDSSSANGGTVDFLQFPVQTLRYRAGDCDDLSILYCSLMEALGVKSAFITVPGHIYAAFSLDMGEDEARRNYYGNEDLIWQDRETWVPVEITLLEQGFTEAWRKGAEQWRQFRETGQAKLLPVREAWKLYTPVGIRSEELDVPEDFLACLEPVYSSSLSRTIGVVIAPEEQRLLSLLAKDANDAQLRNRLGVLYAKAGLLEKAEGQFAGVLARKELLSALVNMANLRILQGRGTEALDLLGRALAVSPENPAVLLGMSRVMYGLGRFAEATDLYSRAAAGNAALTRDYAYLAQDAGTVNRSSDRAKTTEPVWIE
ncbi:MAG: tetratricopeptide repeat protein [Spirochaetes bacterium]|nr:tetratricopeptide repeat protein [Spirochaetota bacterium]